MTCNFYHCTWFLSWKAREDLCASLPVGEMIFDSDLQHFPNSHWSHVELLREFSGSKISSLAHFLTLLLCLSEMTRVRHFLELSASFRSDYSTVSFFYLSIFKWVGKMDLNLLLPLSSPALPTCKPPPSLLQSISRSLLFFGVHSVCACVTVCERESSNCVSVWLWGSCEVHLTDRPSPAAVPFSCGRPAAWWAAKEPPSWERIQPALFVRNGEKECRRDTKAAGE